MMAKMKEEAQRVSLLSHICVTCEKKCLQLITPRGRERGSLVTTVEDMTRRITRYIMQASPLGPDQIQRKKPSGRPDTAVVGVHAFFEENNTIAHSLRVILYVCFHDSAWGSRTGLRPKGIRADSV